MFESMAVHIPVGPIPRLMLAPQKQNSKRWRMCLVCRTHNDKRPTNRAFQVVEDARNMQPTKPPKHVRNNSIAEGGGNRAELWPTLATTNEKIEEYRYLLVFRNLSDLSSVRAKQHSIVPVATTVLADSFAVVSVERCATTTTTTAIVWPLACVCVCGRPCAAVCISHVCCAARESLSA